MVTLTIGVCSLQGAFREHIEKLESLEMEFITVVEVRDASVISKLDGLIIPGGESTAMRIIAEYDGFVEAIRKFVESGKIQLVRHLVGVA